MEDRIPKDMKLSAAKDIVASYVRNNQLKPAEVADLFKQIYRTIDETIPDPQKRSIGLGA